MADEPKITPRTLVPLAVVGSACVLVVTLYAWLSGQFQGLRDEIRSVGFRMERLEERSADRWTATDMELWASDLKRENSTIKVPDVEPRQLIKLPK